MKNCSYCNEYKSLDSFTPSSNCKDGYRGICLSCNSIKQAEWYRKKIKKTIYNRTCLECNSTFSTQISKQKYCNKKCTNKNHNKKKNKNYTNISCKKCNVLFKPKHFTNIYCSEKCRKIKLTVAKKCITCYNAFSTSYSKKIYCSDSCRENNITKTLSGNLRSRIWYAIKQYKPGSAIKDLGCSVEELKEHLESQFIDSMSWGNYGLKGWHIDHIRPLDSFNLVNLDEFKEACHYTNLQPLWAKDNLSKGAKYAEK